MDDSKLRAWWWQRQGLDGSLRGKSSAEILERAGRMRESNGGQRLREVSPMPDMFAIGEGAPHQPIDGRSRYGHRLGLTRPFLYELAPVVIQ